jgi:hypothetical protein
MARSRRALGRPNSTPGAIEARRQRKSTGYHFLETPRATATRGCRRVDRTGPVPAVCSDSGGASAAAPLPAPGARACAAWLEPGLAARAAGAVAAAGPRGRDSEEGLFAVWVPWWVVLLPYRLSARGWCAVGFARLYIKTRLLTHGAWNPVATRDGQRTKGRKEEEGGVVLIRTPRRRTWGRLRWAVRLGWLAGDWPHLIWSLTSYLPS